ncbi:hypothetical protein POL58_31090 [Nannocystis sp. ncelm1]|uniref:Transposase n=1 Tax=Nannocystis radixulma TaxID=2995305 RepID=A0ABT5BF49_9BACT|nr:hypothetical protein [Nannocystis radixulma]MDC0672235.1 hypothetical protein [Nannocystis radixulma]
MTATEERWRARVTAWARSGLSCKAYAVKAGVHPGTLAGWKSKLSRHPAAVQDPSVSFVEVTQHLAVEDPGVGSDLRLHAAVRHAVQLRHARPRGTAGDRRGPMQRGAVRVQQQAVEPPQDPLVGQERVLLAEQAASAAEGG